MWQRTDGPVALHGCADVVFGQTPQTAGAVIATVAKAPTDARIAAGGSEPTAVHHGHGGGEPGTAVSGDLATSNAASGTSALETAPSVGVVLGAGVVGLLVHSRRRAAARGGCRSGPARVTVGNPQGPWGAACRGRFPGTLP